MIRKLFFVLIIVNFSAGIGIAQSFIKTSDLFPGKNENPQSGRLNIYQDPSLDTLISRYISVNKTLYDKTGKYGMNGYRIQIYNSSSRNARDESIKVQTEFMKKFKEIDSYQLFAEPGYWKIRVGDFRTKTEAIKLFLSISREFPDAYLVPDYINFPDLKKK